MIKLSVPKKGIAVRGELTQDGGRILAIITTEECTCCEIEPKQIAILTSRDEILNFVKRLTPESEIRAAIKKTVEFLIPEALI